LLAEKFVSIVNGVSGKDDKCDDGCDVAALLAGKFVSFMDNVNCEDDKHGDCGDDECEGCHISLFYSAPKIPYLVTEHTNSPVRIKQRQSSKMSGY
jgi:hypothetical protein